MVYAEWILNGEFDNGLFRTWDEYHAAMFNPEIKIILVKKI